MSKQTVSINGVTYDAATGLRISHSLNQSHKPTSTTNGSVHSHQVHSRRQRATTLSRAHVSIPKKHQEAKERAVAHRSHIVKSPLVQKFASTPTHSSLAKTNHPKKLSADIQPVKHPLQHKVKQTPAVQRPSGLAHPSAQQLKEQAITRALEKSQSHNSATHKKRPRSAFGKRHPQFISAATASLAVILLAGYLTYINLPNISVQIASAQAGINAEYPAYQPAGYSIKGPVSFGNGEVSIRFAANTSSEQFTINQSKSNWDSGALLDNYVKQQSNGDYVAYNDSGLTIYTYGTKAAWVNGGILHTIDGDAQLSGDQVRQIATSM